VVNRLKNPLIHLTSIQARRIWLHAPRLDATKPFGCSPQATPAAVALITYGLRLLYHAGGALSLKAL
jgi:hypothetical protein